MRAAGIAAQEPQARNERLDQVVDNKNNGLFGVVVGGIVAVAAVIFIFSGGELGGKKTVEGDQDLPPVADSSQ